MGWASGSQLAETVWNLFRHHVPKKERKVVARELVRAFEDEDCDTIHEAETLYKDAELEEDED